MLTAKQARKALKEIQDYKTREIINLELAKIEIAISNAIGDGENYIYLHKNTRPETIKNLKRNGYIVQKDKRLGFYTLHW